MTRCKYEMHCYFWLLLEYLVYTNVISYLLIAVVRKRMLATYILVKVSDNKREIIYFRGVNEYLKTRVSLGNTEY